MSDSTTTTTTKAKALPAQTLKGLTTRVADLKAHETEQDRTVADAEWTRVRVGAEDLFHLGQYLKDSVLPRMEDQTQVTSPKGIVKAFTSESSGIYVPTEARTNLPTQTQVSRSLQVYRQAETLPKLVSLIADFRKVGNRPNLTGSFLPWLALATGHEVGAGSHVLPDATGTRVIVPTDDGETVHETMPEGLTKATKAKVRTVPGVVVRKASTSKGPKASTAESRTLWDVVAAKSDDDLRAMTEGLDFGEWTTEDLAHLAEQAAAAYILRTRAEQADDTPKPKGLADLIGK